MNKEFVLGVDLDGVCADYYEGIRPIVAEWLDVPIDSLTTAVSYGLKEWGISEAPGGYEDFHRFAVTQRGLFQHLKPFHRCPIVMRKISKLGVRIRIITHRLYIKHFHMMAAFQTIQWLDKYGIPYWDLCFMKEKGQVDADLYIEDSPDNVVALREQNRAVVVFTNSTNHDCGSPKATNWDEIYKIVEDQFALWKRSSN